MSSSSQLFTDVIAFSAAIYSGKLLILSSTPPEPSWVQLILGPLGALVVLVCVAVWLSKRNEKLDARSEASQAALLNLVQKTTEAVTASREVIEHNTHMLNDVQKTLVEHKEQLNKHKTDIDQLKLSL